MFHDTDAIDPYVSDVVVDEFQRTYSSAGARFAFLSARATSTSTSRSASTASTRRLADLERPALFVWGSHDTLIPPGFKRHVAEWLPRAEQIVLEGCGHVPQVERPDQTNGLIRRFLARADALGTARRRRQAA